MDESIIKDICTYLIQNINESLSISDIADIFHYNKYYLIRKFKEVTGFTINEFINDCRVYNSIDSLVFTNDTILKIALTNGFNSLEYYSKRFKDTIGISPINFRNYFKTLATLSESTTDLDVLEYVSDSFNKLKEYQSYLNNRGENISGYERPKVLTLKTTVK